MRRDVAEQMERVGRESPLQRWLPGILAERHETHQRPGRDCTGAVWFYFSETAPSKGRSGDGHSRVRAGPFEAPYVVKRCGSS
jgi:hypothetical protein